MKPVVLICFFLVACGADRPFERGKKNSPFDGGNKLTDPGEPNEPELSETYFTNQIMPLMRSDCSMCHAAIPFERAKELVELGSPETSPLYLKATGTGHPQKWSRNSDEAKTLAEWIDGA